MADLNSSVSGVASTSVNASEQLNSKKKEIETEIQNSVFSSRDSIELEDKLSKIDNLNDLSKFTSEMGDRANLVQWIYDHASSNGNYFIKQGKGQGVTQSLQSSLRPYADDFTEDSKGNIEKANSWRNTLQTFSDVNKENRIFRGKADPNELHNWGRNMVVRPEQEINYTPDEMEDILTSLGLKIRSARGSSSISATTQQPANSEQSRVVAQAPTTAAPATAPVTPAPAARPPYVRIAPDQSGCQQTSQVKQEQSGCQQTSQQPCATSEKKSSKWNDFLKILGIGGLGYGLYELSRPSGYYGYPYGFYPYNNTFVNIGIY